MEGRRQSDKPMEKAKEMSRFTAAKTTPMGSRCRTRTICKGSIRHGTAAGRLLPSQIIALCTKI